MKHRQISLVGAPVEFGAGVRGCALGPAALRLAGLAEALTALGHAVEDRGDCAPVPASLVLPGRANHAADIAGWARSLADAAYRELCLDRTPIFLGGDHALAMGSVAGAARYAAEQSRPLFVLWLDAHADFNTPATSLSGNMHGMPAALFCGEAGFEGVLPAEWPTLDPQHLFMVGIRSVDRAERELLAERRVTVYDMRALDELGMAAIMRRILHAVARAGALLHVSLDVDFLDPLIAPGVGTTVPGGANIREAHLVMEMLAESGLVTSLDLAELNPFLDERGRSAYLLVDLAASLFGRTVLEPVAGARAGALAPAG